MSILGEESLGRGDVGMTGDLFDGQESGEVPDDSLRCSFLWQEFLKLETSPLIPQEVQGTVIKWSQDPISI